MLRFGDRKYCSLNLSINVRLYGTTNTGDEDSEHNPDIHPTATVAGGDDPKKDRFGENLDNPLVLVGYQRFPRVDTHVGELHLRGNVADFDIISIAALLHVAFKTDICPPSSASFPTARQPSKAGDGEASFLSSSTPARSTATPSVMVSLWSFVSAHGNDRMRNSSLIKDEGEELSKLDT